MNVTTNFSSVFYISVLSVVIAIFLIVFLIKKLKYNSKQVWKSVGTSLSITVGVQALLLVVSLFLPQPVCTIGSNCPSNSQLLIQASVYTTPIIFLIVTLFYYMTKLLKSTK